MNIECMNTITGGKCQRGERDSAPAG